VRRSTIIAASIIAVATFSGDAFGRDNISEVRESLKAKHEKVIFGKKIDYLEYAKFLASMAAGPSGVAAYLENLAVAIVKETGQEVAQETLYDLIKGKQENMIAGGKPVYVGVVSYNHWTEEKYPKIDRGRLSW